MVQGPQDTQRPLLVTTEILEWLSAPEQEETKQLLRLWNDLQKDGVLSLRSLTLPPMAPFLKYIIIWEPVDEWKDARVRLMGDKLIFRFGGNIKGKLMSEVFSHIEKPQHIGLLRAGMRLNKPSFIKSYMRCGHIEMMTLELFSCPIRDVGGKSMLAMVYVKPYPQEQQPTYAHHAPRTTP